MIDETTFDNTFIQKELCKKCLFLNEENLTCEKGCYKEDEICSDFLFFLTSDINNNTNQ